MIGRSFLAILQRCREEREKIVREEAMANPSAARAMEPRRISSTFKTRKSIIFLAGPSSAHNHSLPRP